MFSKRLSFNKHIIKEHTSMIADSFTYDDKQLLAQVYKHQD